MSKKVVFLHETVWQSIARDVGSFVTVIALAFVANLSGSSVVEFFTIFFGVLLILASAKKLTGKYPSMTRDEARKWLKREFPSEGARD